MINTERLLLIPLSHSQVQMYLLNDGTLEKDLGLNSTEREITDRLRVALETKILPALADSSKNYLFYTIWTAVLKLENKMVADYVFKGEPNENNVVDIGYATYPAFQGKGFMTEAVGGLITWCIDQKNIKAITAETNKENIGSIKVLQQNNFVEIKASDTSLWWRFDIS